MCILLGETGDTQCLILQFFWVTSILLRRDIQLKLRSSGLCQCCCGGGRALSPLPCVQMKYQGCKSKGTCLLSQLLQRQSQVCLISMAMSSSDVPVGNEVQRMQGWRRVADCNQRHGGIGAFRNESLPPGVKNSWDSTR